MIGSDMTLKFASLFGAALFGLSAIAQSGAPEVEGPSRFDAVPAEAVSPFGGLSLTPTRLVLSPGDAMGEVTLYNSGGETVTYRVEDVELEALEQGGYGQVEEDADAPEWSAARFLRYAPRQVTLAPGERQLVRVISRAPRDMTAGEYRSHMRFSSIPTVAPVDELENEPEASDDTSVEVRVGLEYRITIPVILRTGDGAYGTEIQSASLEANPDSEGTSVRVTLNKTGSWSDYGVLRVLDAAGEEIGLLRGVSVLPPLTSRVVNIPLNVPDAVPARVVFETDNNAADLIASAEVG
ncbi:MAG: hypothetical protein CBB65_12330 [Hyphomonadaceae bacterium TMED5]|nr:hypothetical protein [Ponticaulis sp.]OUX98539.1 MAG: hypothetical protein CBB65_12330 [Hyphomonadaceae bacterium TMED5]|tara:strand:- start:59869 stop:60756 length:888 start_codon:yes stop_codon:yes gene_type:complete